MELVQAYTIINSILYKLTPVENIASSYYVGLVNEIQNTCMNEKLLSLKIDLEEAKLKFHLLTMDVYLKTGQIEYDKNELSYRGVVYRIEKGKNPLQHQARLRGVQP